MSEHSYPGRLEVSRLRGRRLLEMLRTRGRLDVARAARDLAVSSETIRRDFRTLESQGLIHRQYGAAFPVESGRFKPSLSDRHPQYAKEKARIATAAADLLGAARTLFLDEGYQMQLVAESLPRDRRLTVVTSSVPLAVHLATRPELEVLLLGGWVRGNTLGTVGHWAVDMLRSLVIDLALIGANGVSVEAGLTTPDPRVAAVKAAAIGTSRRRVFVGAHYKFDAVSRARFADLSEFEWMVTGNELTTLQASRYTAAGATMHLV